MPQLNAVGLRVVFDCRSRDLGVVVLGDIIDAFQLLDEVYLFSGNPHGDEALGRSEQLHVHRLAMGSPLELLASIPPAFLAGLATPGGFSSFLGFFERVFNLPLAIRVDRHCLLTDQAGLEADRVDHELRSMHTDARIEEFKARANALRMTPKVAEIVNVDDVALSSLKDRMSFLARANDIRVSRAQLKKDLASGKAQIGDVLLDPPEFVHTARVFDLIVAIPRYGRVKANRILGRARISPSESVGGLSEHQRVELVRFFREK